MSKPFVLALGGPDMTGKSQIARALSHALEVPSFKASSEHKTFLTEQNMFLHQLRHALPREIDLIDQGCIPGIIYDRSWPCEYVYAAFYGRETDKGMLRYVDSRMAEFGAKVVICYRSSYEGIVDDIQPLIGAEQLALIEQKYREFATWTRCPVYFLNVDDENLERECDEVFRFLGYKDRLHHLNSYVREHAAFVASGTSACCV